MGGPGVTAPSLRAGLWIEATAGLLSGSRAPQAHAPFSSRGPLPGEAQIGHPQEALPDRLASPADLSADLCPTLPSSPTQLRDAPPCLRLPPAGTCTLTHFAPAWASSAQQRPPPGAAPWARSQPGCWRLRPRLVPAPRLQLPPPCYLHPQTAPQRLCPDPGACLRGAHRRPAGPAWPSEWGSGTRLLSSPMAEERHCWGRGGRQAQPAAAALVADPPQLQRSRGDSSHMVPGPRSCGGNCVTGGWRLVFGLTPLHPPAARGRQASGFVVWPGLGVGHSGPVAFPGPEWGSRHCRGGRAHPRVVVWAEGMGPAAGAGP